MPRCAARGGALPRVSSEEISDDVQSWFEIRHLKFQWIARDIMRVPLIRSHHELRSRGVVLRALLVLPFFYSLSAPSQVRVA